MEKKTTWKQHFLSVFYAVNFTAESITLSDSGYPISISVGRGLDVILLVEFCAFALAAELKPMTCSLNYKRFNSRAKSIVRISCTQFYAPSVHQCIYKNG